MPELSEKDFINEGYSKNPYPLWIWFFLLVVFIGVVWSVSGWYNVKISNMFRASPFLQVTNREISLYLWQNPEYMRVHARKKSGYLPGFQYLDNVTMDLAAVDHYVEAPPDLIFLYHTWKRLISHEFTQRPMPQAEFGHFLNNVPEWTPRYWPAAPEKYVKLIEKLPGMGEENLSTLSFDELPLDVRIAFQGWKNFFKEGAAIESVQPTVKRMREFLAAYPHFARNYWRNIIDKNEPNYLRQMGKSAAEESVIPLDQLTPFLKVAFYNYTMADK